MSRWFAALGILALAIVGLVPGIAFASGLPAAPTAGEVAATDADRAQMDAGRILYSFACAPCHMAEGQGLEAVTPPLAASDYLMEDKERSIRVVLEGLAGPITVNGRPYNAVMLPLRQLSDGEIASILTYVRRSFGNSGDAVSAAEVAKVRAGAARPPVATP